MDAARVETAAESEATNPVETEAVSKPGEMNAEAPAEEVAPFIDKVAVPPVAELAKLIGELIEAKTYLETEGERIQREIDGYLQLSQNTVESIKMIAGAVAEWRSA